jgi:hypothetical protein
VDFGECPGDNDARIVERIIQERSIGRSGTDKVAKALTERPAAAMTVPAAAIPCKRFLRVMDVALLLATGKRDRVNADYDRAGHGNKFG